MNIVVHDLKCAFTLAHGDCDCGAVERARALTAVWQGTPGPWCVVPDALVPFDLRVHSPAGHIAKVYGTDAVPNKANAAGIAAVPQLVEALAECREYFDGRADAECDPSSPGFTGNEEMRLLVLLDAALKAAGVTP